MSAALDWRTAPVAVIAGMSDTRLKKQLPYRAQPLGELLANCQPQSAPKKSALAFLPSLYAEFDARDHAAQRERGQFVALVGDIDKGNHPLDLVADKVAAVVGEAAWTIYSTASARPDDRRWRVVIPLAEAVGFDVWHDAQLALVEALRGDGFELDMSAARAGQIAFLPNVPAEARDAANEPLFFERVASDPAAPGLELWHGTIADAIASLQAQREADDAERERIKAEAIKRRPRNPASSDDGGSMIEAFNRENTLSTMLERHGYEQSPRHGQDWRSPMQTSDSFATRVIEGGKWISLSASDAASGLGERCAAGCFGDAFDLFAHFEHGGDRKAALRVLHTERKASNSRHSEPPTSQGQEKAKTYQGEHKGGASHLPMMWWHDVTPQLNDLWLIKKLVPATGLCVIYGHPGSGKTFLALDFAFHVATGRDWHDRKVKQGLVVYVAAEGQAGLRNRITALKAHYGDQQIALALVPTAIDLQAHNADTPRLIELIKGAAEECGYDPALIVIDTLSKTFGGGKENTDDMATYVANCGLVANAFECCVAPVHHRPKDAESSEPRGHSSLKGGADTVILVEAGVTKKATVTKQKDAEIGERILFNLLPIRLGEDEDGEEVTSCVVLPATIDMNVSANPVAQARAKLSDKNKIVLRELGQALVHDGVAVPGEIPDTVINRAGTLKVARIDAWRTRAEAALRTGSDSKPDTARRTFDRAREALQGKGIIGVWEGFAWEL